MHDLNIFIAILMVSSFNKRKSQRDYWLKDPFLSCEVVCSAMARDTFENIKSKLKYSKSDDNNSDDKGWQVRALLTMFQKNILYFGIWRTALLIDEMMVLCTNFTKTIYTRETDSFWDKILGGLYGRWIFIKFGSLLWKEFVDRCQLG